MNLPFAVLGIELEKTLAFTKRLATCGWSFIVMYVAAVNKLSLRSRSVKVLDNFIHVPRKVLCQNDSVKLFCG